VPGFATLPPLWLAGWAGNASASALRSCASSLFLSLFLLSLSNKRLIAYRSKSKHLQNSLISDTEHSFPFTLSQPASNHEDRRNRPRRRICCYHRFRTGIRTHHPIACFARRLPARSLVVLWRYRSLLHQRPSRRTIHRRSPRAVPYPEWQQLHLECQHRRRPERHPCYP